MTISQDHGRCKCTGTKTPVHVHCDELAVTVGDIGCALIFLVKMTKEALNCQIISQTEDN